MKFSKKILAAVLAALMAISMMPFTAFAADDPYADIKNTTTVITFDNKQWYMLDYDDSTVTLLSKECVGKSVFGTNNTYSGSTLETYVNNWYSENITADAKTAVADNKAFILESLNGINADVLKCNQVEGTMYNLWWLCSKDHSESRAMCVDGQVGYLDSLPVGWESGVRPALKLDLSKVEFDSETKTFALPAPAPADEPTVTWYAATENIQIGEDCDQPNPYDASYTKDAITVSATSEEGQTYIDGTRFSEAFMGALSGFVFTNSVANFSKIKLVFTDLSILSYNKFIDSEYNDDPHWSSNLDSKTVTWEGDSNSVGLYAYGVEGTLDRIEFTYEEPAPSAYAGYLPAATDDATALAAKVVKFNGYNWYLIEDNSTSETEGTVTLFAADTSFGTKSFDDNENLSNKYSTSTVKTYLDGMTATGGAFADVADAIETVTLTTDNDTDVTAKLYLLSKSEAGALPTNVLMLDKFANADYYGEAYWLRSPDPNDGMDAAYVSTYDGTIQNGSQVYRIFGVRPALQLDLSKVEFDSETNTFALPTPAIDSVSYIDAAYDSATNTVTYTDATCDDYTAVAADTTTFEDGKWYVVNSNVTVNGSITVNGAANLILADGYTLTVTQGVAVTDPSSLTIFGQENGTGTLTATSTSYSAAGIGGIDNANGPITINGGTVNATSGGAGAGIGGGDMGNGGPVVINGGTVTAIGGEDDGAGIGSGGNGSSCNVTINGGTVNATGRHTYDNTAGIGNSSWSSNGGNIAINGGTVNAACAAGSQGIGGSGCTISITGGTVDVNRGVTDASYGLFGSSFTMSGGEVYVNRFVYVNTTITGGTLIAQANPPFQSDVSIGTGLKVLAGANEESAVEVEPSAINMSSGVYWNSKWIKIYPAPVDPVVEDSAALAVGSKTELVFHINADAHNATKIVVSAPDNTKENNTAFDTEYTNVSGEDYVIRVALAPSQIKERINVAIYNGSTLVTEYNYSIYDYCFAAVEEADYPAAAKNLVKAFVNYAAASQKAVEWNNSGDYAIEDDELYEVASATPSSVAHFSAIDGVTLTSATVICRNETAVRFYYTGNVESASVSGIPGAKCTVYDNAIDVTGIPAQYIDDAFTLTINGTAIQYSVDSYNAKALQYFNGGSVQYNLAQALANYGAYAKAYFG